MAPHHLKSVNTLSCKVGLMNRNRPYLMQNVFQQQETETCAVPWCPCWWPPILRQEERQKQCKVQDGTPRWHLLTTPCIKKQAILLLHETLASYNIFGTQHQEETQF